MYSKLTNSTGVAGLSASASILKHCKAAQYPVNVTILEARERLGGRVNTVELQDKTRVDLGAAFVHGCNKTNPVYAIARKKQNVCVHTAHGGYSQGWFKGPWYDRNGKRVTKEEWRDLEKLHEVIRGDLWNRAKELRNKSKDESIGDAFKRYYAVRAKERDTPLMRRLMSSKNTLMWAYTAALDEVSLTAAYADDERDRDSKVQHTCLHVIEASNALKIPMDMLSLRKLFAEKDKSNVHRWFCLQSGEVLISGNDEHDDTMTRHVQEKGHHLFISLSQLSCWCASCRVFLDIYAQDMIKILQCVSRLHVAKYGFELDIFKRDSFVLSEDDKMLKRKEEEEKKKKIKKEKEEERKMNWHRHASVRLALKRSTQQEEPVKKRQRRYRKRHSYEGSENWIQCEDCRKWRKLPTDRPLDLNKIERWTCSMNNWDRGRANCLCPEEVRHRRSLDLSAFNSHDDNNNNNNHTH